MVYPGTRNINMRAGKKIRRQDCGMYWRLFVCRLLQNGKNARRTRTRGGGGEVISYYKFNVKNMFYQQISMFDHDTFPTLQYQIV
jgi:hypothetical protein